MCPNYNHTYKKKKKKHTQETRNCSSTQSRLRPWTPPFTCLFGGKGCVKLKAPRSVFVGGCSQFSFLECKSCMQYISSKHFQTHVCRLRCSGFFFFSSFTGTHWCLFIPVWHGNHLADRFQSAFCINLISLIIRKPDSINQGKEFKKDLDFEFSWSCKYMCAWLKCSDGGKLLVEKRNEIKGRITKLLYSQFQAGCLKSDFKIRHGSSISLSDSPLVCSRVKVCFIAAAELQVQTTAL